MISTPVALLVLLSALMHAGWNYLVKASPDRLADTVGYAVAGSLLSACLLPFFPSPARESWPWLGGTVFIHVAYFLAVVETYRHADLSLAYPLMRGLAPLLVALAAPLAGDATSPALLLGVLLIAAGIVFPAALGIHHGAVAARSLVWPLGVAALIAFYTLVDGVGVRRSGSPVAFTLWLFLLDAWGIYAVARWRRGALLVTHLRARVLPALVGSVLTVGSYGIVLWAMTVAAIPAVAALRETSVIFAAILGASLLKERMGPPRIAGAVLVAAGGAVIRWG